MKRLIFVFIIVFIAICNLNFAYAGWFVDFTEEYKKHVAGIMNEPSLSLPKKGPFDTRAQAEAEAKQIEKKARGLDSFAGPVTDIIYVEDQQLPGDPDIYKEMEDRKKDQQLFDQLKQLKDELKGNEGKAAKN